MVVREERVCWCGEVAAAYDVGMTTNYRHITITSLEFRTEVCWLSLTTPLHSHYSFIAHEEFGTESAAVFTSIPKRMRLERPLSSGVTDPALVLSDALGLV